MENSFFRLTLPATTICSSFIIFHELGNDALHGFEIIHQLDLHLLVKLVTEEKKTVKK